MFEEQELEELQYQKDKKTFYMKAADCSGEIRLRAEDLL